jgi:hypothetical protein
MDNQPITNTEQITVEEWKKRVLDLCQKPGVSMAEISRMPNAHGERSLRFEECLNIVIWDGIQTNLVDAISQLLADGLIVMRTTSLLIYLVYGNILRLPVAKSGTRKYKTPHWLPVVIDLAKKVKANGEGKETGHSPRLNHSADQVQ